MPDSMGRMTAEERARLLALPMPRFEIYPCRVAASRGPNVQSHTIEGIITRDARVLVADGGRKGPSWS